MTPNEILKLYLKVITHELNDWAGKWRPRITDERQ